MVYLKDETIVELAVPFWRFNDAPARAQQTSDRQRVEWIDRGATGIGAYLRSEQSTKREAIGTELVVLVACHSSAKYGLAGGELSILAIVREWRAQHPETEFIFVTPQKRGLLEPEIEALGCEHIAIGTEAWLSPRATRSMREKASALARNMDGLSLLIRLIKGRGVDLVITNTIVNPWAAVAASLTRTPHVWMVREYGDIDHNLNFLEGKAQTLAAVGEMSDLVVANSEAIAEYLRPYISDANIIVSYPPVTIEPAQLADIAASASRRESVLRVTCVGRITPSKGQASLVSAVGALSRRGVDVLLTLVGPSAPVEHAEELLALAAELGVGERVVIYPQTSDVREFIVDADVCVTPSSMEAFGRTTLEYMLLGKPVVATRTGGSLELVEDGVNGWLVHPDDPVDLADAIQKYALDATLIARHGLASLAKANDIRSSDKTVTVLVPQLERVGNSPTTVAGTPYFTAERLHDISMLVRWNPAAPVTREHRLGAFIIRPFRPIIPIVRALRRMLRPRPENG